MAASSRIFALPWYARGDYPALLELFSDSTGFPATFDAWLENAERIERQFEKASFGVTRIWIRPALFAAWCKDRNVPADQAARLTFVSEAVHGSKQSK
jgi:hypothetical protein